MYIKNFNPNFSRIHPANKWTITEVDEASDKIVCNYANDDTESEVTITILPTTNSIYYHIEFLQEIWYYEDSTRSEVEDFDGYKETRDFQKIDLGSKPRFTIEDIVENCLFGASSRIGLISSMDVASRVISARNKRKARI